jgi:dimethylhistidine N-methyltransferase
MTTNLRIYDYEPEVGDVYEQILDCLRRPVKTLPYMVTYDERGSQLFEQMCGAEEYYLFRTELTILQQYAGEIAAQIGEKALLVEYGSGNSAKTRALLDTLPQLAGYVPIDISREFLLESAQALAVAYPQIEFLPVCADYNTTFALPTPAQPAASTVAYFAGSTIGTMPPEEAVAFLARVRQRCGEESGLLISVDLKKDPATILRAYNVPGITSEFILNVLRHLNHVWQADFVLDQFQFLSIYNSKAGRQEVSLVSLTDQTVQIGDAEIAFAAGERLWHSDVYKYTVAEFAELAAKAGWGVKKVWTDERNWFSVQYLSTTNHS